MGCIRNIMEILFSIRGSSIWNKRLLSNERSHQKSHLKLKFAAGYTLSICQDYKTYAQIEGEIRRRKVNRVRRRKGILEVRMDVPGSHHGYSRDLKARVAVEDLSFASKKCSDYFCFASRV